MKKYYIKRIGYMYDDDRYELVKGFGGLQDGFDDIELAKKEMMRLNGIGMKNIPLMRYGSQGFSEEIAIQLGNYLKMIVGEEGLEKKKNFISDDFIPNSSYRLPDMADEYLWRISEITGIKFYQLIEVKEDTLELWGIKLGNSKNQNHWFSSGASRITEKTGEAIFRLLPLVFNSRQEAFEVMSENMYSTYAELRKAYELAKTGDRINLENISHVPNILKSFIAQNEEIFFDPALRGRMNIQKMDSEKLVILNSLLREKVMDVIPFPIDEALKIGIGWYPIQ